LPGSKPRNPSLSRQALELARLANPHLLANEQRFWRDLLQSSNAKEIFGSFTYFDRNSRLEFLSRYAASNSSVARDFLDDNSGRLFPSDVQEGDDEQKEGSGQADLGETLANIFRVLHRRGNSFEVRATRKRILKVRSRILSRLPSILRKAKARLSS